ncbi:hypothetical protein AUJ66_03550 [Candidatus Desantisbacteria bacterium CG1_02_38_46]|uniref:RNA polymerase sigma factor n=3 Tax=unclassified Candidatus Desantisiibacteriota TaxID=3106372 RepID=A0A2H9PA60_9BACT|nr:MAG: hypothetical protein AUJ66_03550 [Candidatus Desantisbacteria bacterium CG1_02_38_46]PIU52172.1 MAG: RNA polymerase subunit sigma-70 [Candidatus Desantisbacteria bacterium CG07_land_8_20_14_0_80_39_15]PIZ15260.1 MAG: RNA polymerase subunit sigma-70 [Candidatus Desantisbacteria bacterium CG_4_10_14_0_8_um_filter_39_17]
MQETDEILIKKIATGDEIAFEEMVLRYQNKVLNLIYRHINSSSEAEEIAQDVFVKVWSQAKSFKGNSKLSTWLYRIAINLSINHLRKKKLKTVSLDKGIFLPDGKIKKDIAAPIDLQPDFAMAKNRQALLIKNAVDSLPPTQKTAFILSKYENHSYARISEIMNLSIPAIESLLFRAKQNLKKFLLPFREKGEL